MKTLQNNLKSAFTALILCAGMILCPACNSGDDGIDPCEQFECLNGGEKITGIDNCSCDCPPGYSGDNCQIQASKCPVTVECPIGKSPNPENNCVCE